MRCSRLGADGKRLPFSAVSGASHPLKRVLAIASRRRISRRPSDVLPKTSVRLGFCTAAGHEPACALCGPCAAAGMHAAVAGTRPLVSFLLRLTLRLSLLVKITSRLLRWSFQIPDPQRGTSAGLTGELGSSCAQACGGASVRVSVVNAGCTEYAWGVKETVISNTKPLRASAFMGP